MIQLDPDRNGPLRIWRLPDPQKAYSVGADTAEGISRLDWSAAVVVERETGAHCATWRGHSIPSDFAEVLMQLGEFYGENTNGQAYMTIETNNHGLACLNKIRDLGYYNLYTRDVWDQIESKWQSVVGFQTSIRTRPILINRGRDSLASKDATLYDLDIIGEAETFVVNENGKEEHLPGCHDDTLIAWMLAQEGRYREINGWECKPNEEQKADGERQHEVDKQRRERHSWVHQSTKEYLDDRERTRSVIWTGY